MGQLLATSVRFISKLSERERLILLEIGGDKIDSASLFVEYIFESYNIPKSSIWYLLKKLKIMDLIDFATKEEVGKPLSLTKMGEEELKILKKKNSSVLPYNAYSIQQALAP